MSIDTSDYNTISIEMKSPLIKRSNNDEIRCIIFYRDTEETISINYHYTCKIIKTKHISFINDYNNKSSIKKPIPDNDGYFYYVEIYAKPDDFTYHCMWTYYFIITKEESDKLYEMNMELITYPIKKID